MQKQLDANKREGRRGKPQRIKTRCQMKLTDCGKKNSDMIIQNRQGKMTRKIQIALDRNVR
jgi:hypothetical protein